MSAMYRACNLRRPAWEGLLSARHYGDDSLCRAVTRGLWLSGRRSPPPACPIQRTFPWWSLPLRAVAGGPSAIYSARPDRNEHTHMIAAVVLVLVHSALIVALLVQRLKRLRAEDAVRRLIATQDSVRYRLARELHDNLSQKLAALCIEISRLGARASFSPAMAEPVAHLAERAKDIAVDVRCLSHGLYPPALELLGLSPAIERLCQDVSRQCGVRIDFRPGVVGRQLSRDAVLCLFRITQEALQNIVKHSGAKHATVSLAETGRKICLHIADSGRGFDHNWRDRAGLGLLSMRERALLAGGRMGIRTSADRGTRLMVTIRLNREPVRTRLLESA